MAERRQLLVLANSAKTGGRCLACKFVERNERGVWIADGWCRPVLPDGNRHDAMPSGVCDQFNPLDVIQIDLEGPLPSSSQPENWRWQADTAISLEDTLNQMRNSVAPLAESPPDHWPDRCQRDASIAALRLGQHGCNFLAPGLGLATRERVRERSSGANEHEHAGRPAESAGIASGGGRDVGHHECHF
jgi:hypothetical protein